MAPQAPVKGIEGLPNSSTNGGRIFIPNGVKKDFLESHTISNYKWIFNIPILTTEAGKGHVKIRN